MPKVALFKSKDNLDYYNDYKNYLEPIVQEWQDVPEDYAQKIRQAIIVNNSSAKADFYYVLIEEGLFGEELPTLFKNAQDYYDKVEKQRIVEEKRKEAEKAKNEAKALERKRKQLEKLKKELEQ